MPDMLIRAGTLITPLQTFENTELEVRGGRIASIRPPSGRRPDIDASDRIVAPGYIDIHVHGGDGLDTMDGTYDAIAGMAKHLARHGVTSFLAATLTAPWDEIRAALSAVREAMSRGTGGAECLGAHLEGPFINPGKPGAQALEHIRQPSVAEMEPELGDLIDVIRVVTLAPEMPSAVELIRYLVGRGITVSLGHTDAVFAEAISAFEAGARNVTHIFNAMRPLHHREPGVIGAALWDDRVRAEMIWDNVHLHPAVAEVAARAKGPERVALVSDAMRAAGLPDGTYTLGAYTVSVRGGEARLSDGTIAGSTLTLDQAVRNAAARLSPADAIRMAAETPARAAGVAGRKGRLDPGCDADILILTPDLEVEQVLIAGQRFPALS